MYEFAPMTDRVQRVREMYRTTTPFIDTWRYRLVTDFYKTHRSLRGNLKRALNFANLCENLPIWIRDDELIVGTYTETFKASALYPEYGLNWLIPELEADLLPKRDSDPYQYTAEDREYLLATASFWDGESLGDMADHYIPENYARMYRNCVVNFMPGDLCPQPIGHFAPNYRKVIDVGLGAVKAQAEAKMQELEAKGMPGGADQYNFYRGSSIVCGAMITFAKRYSAEAARLASECTDPIRKAELEQIADTMSWVIEKPARNFRDAIQTVWFYQMCVLMDANMHGCSVGRFDQFVGKYAERDIAAGVITEAEAQELIDMYFLKVAECNKVWGARTAYSSPGYTSGQMITVGGIDKDGSDATNIVTYMVLEAIGRMKLHTPVLSLRVHREMPKKLWECALAVNRINGGVPTFESDDAIIPALLKRGISEEDVWDYCLIGCVEPSIGGKEWPACGGLGISSYTNFVNILLLALNNGKSFRQGTDPNVDTETQFGPETGYLYEMNSIEEVMAAYQTMMEYWVSWYANMVNIHESVAFYEMRQPVVSVSMEGCMESGRDVMQGGSKYNSTGMSGIGLGNVAESFNVINELCFKRKKCTTRELYDAIVNNWEGYDELRQYIQGALPHYGNGDPEIDRFAQFVADGYADYVVTHTSRRGHYAPGMYPVTMNVVYGKMTAATPDGRRSGEPLSDGISAVQGFDTSGPTAILNSVTCFDHTKYSNGLLLNMKFHPSAVSSEEGLDKLISLLKTYFFDMQGMEMQMNIISTETMRDAQAHPENYRDLVVRIAGFSAYFVEVFKSAQDDLIRRTELGL